MNEALEKARAAHQALLDARAAGEAVAVATAALGEFPDTPDGLADLRAAASFVMAGYRVGGGFDCPALGGRVEVRQSGIRKVLSMSADRRKLQLLPALGQMLSVAKLVATRPPYNGDRDTNAKAYHVLRALVRLDGELLAVRLIVKEDNRGQFHYDQTVHAPDAIFDAAKENAPTCGALLDTASDGEGTSRSRLVSDQLEGSVAAEGEVINLFIEGETGAAAPVLDSLRSETLAKLRQAAALLAGLRGA